MRTLEQVELAERDRAAVRRAAHLIRQVLPVERLILFGSKARGQSHEESDVDLLALTSRPVTQAERDRVVEVLLPVELELDVLFSTLVVPLEEWERGVYQVLSLRHEVERDGVAA